MIRKKARPSVTSVAIFPESLACSRLSVSGHDRKSGRGTSGIWPGKKKSAPSPIFFYKIPLVQKPLFRSSPLTESLEQATESPPFASIGNKGHVPCHEENAGILALHNKCCWMRCNRDKETFRRIFFFFPIFFPIFSS